MTLRMCLCLICLMMVYANGIVNIHFYLISLMIVYSNGIADVL